MKRDKIIFWTTTLFIFLFEGVMSLLTYDTEVARNGIRHLGYPDYFGTMLMVYKVLGSIILVIPSLPRRIKEWAYAGFAFDFISAFISTWVVDGLGLMTFFPILILAILVVSYISFDRLRRAQMNIR